MKQQRRWKEVHFSLPGTQNPVTSTSANAAAKTPSALRSNNKRCAQFSSGANKLSNQLTKGKVLYERKNAKGRRLRKWITSASPSNIQQWKRGVKMSNREKEILHIPLTTKKKKQHPLTNQPRKQCRTHTHTCTKQHFFFSILCKKPACQIALWSDSLACLEGKCALHFMHCTFFGQTVKQFHWKK